MWLFYTIWISAAIFAYSLTAYFSYRNNVDGGNWGFALWLYGLFPSLLWVWVSKYSKNLMFDGMLFDSIIFISYAVVLGILTEGFYKFNTGQWVGFTLITIGFIIMKYYEIS